MGGKSQPDFGDVAASQGEDNDRVVREQIFANRPTQYSPWGFTDWSQTPYTAEDGNTYYKWTQTTGLSPELQDIYNKQVAIQGGRTDIAGLLTGRMGADFGQSMDWTGLNPMGQVPTAQLTLPEPDIGNPYENRQRAEDAMFQQAQSRLTPRFESQRTNLETKLRNQGLGPEDAAWKSQMEGINQAETDAMNQATWSAVQQGRDEAGMTWDQMMGQQQNRYNQALGANQANWQQMMQGSQYANAIRQQQITEALQKRGANLNEINALLSGQQVSMPSMPNFSAGAAAQPAPIYQGATDQYNAGQANTQNWMNLIGGLGSSAMMMSDRRLKRDIKRIGTKGGYPWYSYTIFGNKAEGVMSDEIPREFVHDVGGFDMVDYGGLFNG
jgi:hypothetical protein